MRPSTLSEAVENLIRVNYRKGVDGWLLHHQDLVVSPMAAMHQCSLWSLYVSLGAHQVQKGQIASGRGTGVPPVGTEDLTWPGHGRDGHDTKIGLERD